MTKKQWVNLKIGQQVKSKGKKVDRVGENPVLVDTINIGTTVRFNSNCSQVLVRYNDGFESWVGRLGIEL